MLLDTAEGSANLKDKAPMRTFCDSVCKLLSTVISDYSTKKNKKTYSRKGKLNEKKSCTPINPKKYSCYGLKLKFVSPHFGLNEEQVSRLK